MCNVSNIKLTITTRIMQDWGGSKEKGLVALLYNLNQPDYRIILVHQSFLERKESALPRLLLY